MERLKEFASEGMGLAAPLPGSAMQRLHRIKERQGFRCALRLRQTERTEPFKIPHRASELLARIGAEHGIELAIACSKPAEIDGIGGEGSFAVAEPAAAECWL